jgi:hypothetical protein
MMGYSSQQYRKEQQERRWKIHPAWRGIGCILFLIVPIMSWVGASMILQNYQNLAVFYNLARVVVIPFTHVGEIDKIILSINLYFQKSGFMIGQLYVTIIFCLIGYGIMAFLYAILYRVAGPPRYGPFDVPPNRVK